MTRRAHKMSRPKRRAKKLLPEREMDGPAPDSVLEVDETLNMGGPAAPREPSQG